MASTISPKKKQQPKNPLSNKIPFSRAGPGPSIENKILSIENDLEFQKYEQAFILRKLSKFCYHDSTMAQFAPRGFPGYDLFQVSDQLSLRKQITNQPKYKKWHAVYNKDRRYYSPAFVLGVDLRDYIQIPEDDLQKFRQKIKMARKLQSDDTETMYVPRHTGNKCQICKQQYGDYVDHTTSEKHLKKMRKSLGYEFINQFTREFQISKKSTIQNKSMNEKRRRKKGNQKFQSQPQSPKMQKQKRKTKKITKNLFDTPKSKKTGKKSRTPGTSTTNSASSQKVSSAN